MITFNHHTKCGYYSHFQEETKAWLISPRAQLVAGAQFLTTSQLVTFIHSITFTGSLPHNRNDGKLRRYPWVGTISWEREATHSSILAWRIPWIEEPGRLQSMGSQRVGHDWAANTFTFFLFWNYRIAALT